MNGNGIDELLKAWAEEDAALEAEGFERVTIDNLMDLTPEARGLILQQLAELRADQL